MTEDIILARQRGLRSLSFMGLEAGQLEQAKKWVAEFDATEIKEILNQPGGLANFLEEKGFFPLMPKKNTKKVRFYVKEDSAKLIQTEAETNEPKPIMFKHSRDIARDFSDIQKAAFPKYRALLITTTLLALPALGMGLFPLFLKASGVALSYIAGDFLASGGITAFLSKVSNTLASKIYYEETKLNLDEQNNPSWIQKRTYLFGFEIAQMGSSDPKEFTPLIQEKAISSPSSITTPRMFIKAFLKDMLESVNATPSWLRNDLPMHVRHTPEYAKNVMTSFLNALRPPLQRIQHWFSHTLPIQARRAKNALKDLRPWESMMQYFWGRHRLKPYTEINEQGEAVEMIKMQGTKGVFQYVGINHPFIDEDKALKDELFQAKPHLIQCYEALKSPGSGTLLVPNTLANSKKPSP